MQESSWGWCGWDLLGDFVELQDFKSKEEGEVLLAFPARAKTQNWVEGG